MFLLQVEELFDATKETVLQKIVDLVTHRAADLYCVIIMGHGDLDGNISDINSKPISVQEIIDAMDQAAKSAVKVHYTYQTYIISLPNLLMR